MSGAAELMKRALGCNPLWTVEIQITDGKKLYGRSGLLDERDTSALYALAEMLADGLLEDMKGDTK